MKEKDQVNSLPWFRQLNYWSKVAGDYIIAYSNLPIYVDHHIEFKTFSNFMGYRLVFESNLIEGEGLSEGETRKVINKYIHEVPDNYEFFRNIEFAAKEPFWFIRVDRFKEILNNIAKEKLSNNIIPAVSFADKTKGIFAVVQHYAAYLKAIEIPIEFKIQLMKQIIDGEECLTDDKKYIDNVKARMKLVRSIENIPLLNEALIKELHRIMASGLLPQDLKVNAGDYSTDSRMVGDFDIIFPSPELLQKCMSNFIKKANSLVASAFRGDINIFEAAAIISHEFVRIHPFPDFNGRISRIILMILLMTFGVPFPVTLRGNRKYRRRYLYSLKKANSGYYEPYATLIAMRVAELFTEIDSNIVLAGLPTITSFPPLERIESFPIKNFKKAHVTEAIQYRTQDRKFDI